MNKRNTIKQLLHRGCLLMGISAITSFIVFSQWTIVFPTKTFFIHNRIMPTSPHVDFKFKNNNVLQTTPMLGVSCVLARTESF